MTADHPLFSFMPYGAPELLRDARGNLFRATLLSILAGTTALVLAAGVARTLVMPTSPPPPTIVDLGREHLNLAPPALSPPPRRTVEPAPGTLVEAGIAVPTRDELVPVDVTIADQGSLAAISPAGPGVGSGPVELHVAPPAYPAIDDYVYVEELPEPLSAPRPAYPEIAKDAGVEGTVVVHVLVDRDGHVVEVRASPKRTVPLLEPAALDAAAKWVFKPARANRHPVAVWVAIPFEFRLR